MVTPFKNNRVWQFQDDIEPAMVTIIEPATQCDYYLIITEFPTEGGPSIEIKEFRKEDVAATFGFDQHDMAFNELKGFANYHCFDSKMRQIIYEWQTNSFVIGVITKLDNSWIVEQQDPEKYSSKTDAIKAHLADKSVLELVSLIENVCSDRS